jgi:hypothetical protein
VEPGEWNRKERKPEEMDRCRQRHGNTQLGRQTNAHAERKCQGQQSGIYTVLSAHRDLKMSLSRRWDTYDMCALAGYIYSSVSATIKSYLKAFVVGIMRSIPWTWSPRWCASPVTLHDVARRDGAYEVHGCVDTLRRVSRLEPVMTIQLQKPLPIDVITILRMYRHAETKLSRRRRARLCLLSKLAHAPRLTPPPPP